MTAAEGVWRHGEPRRVQLGHALVMRPDGGVDGLDATFDLEPHEDLPETLEDVREILARDLAGIPEIAASVAKAGDPSAFVAAIHGALKHPSPQAGLWSLRRRVYKSPKCGCSSCKGA